MNIGKLLYFLLLSFVTTSCLNEKVQGLKGFTICKSLAIEDSIILEDYKIFNPYYIHYKDSFLIFNSIQGQREIQMLDFSSDKVTEFRVIGQGKNEMQNYHTVNNLTKHIYMFADNRQGKIYGINLDSLRKGSTGKYDLLYSLPIVDNRHFYRFLDISDAVVGIGMLKDGRIGHYEKETQAYNEQMEYPVNNDIDKLSYVHKGALFSGTKMVCDINAKNIVAACFGLIDFYSISEGGIMELKKSNHYHFPLFNVGTLGPAISYKKESLIGITDLCADENYVYALYSDKSFKEYGLDAYNSSCILVWDWNGTPVKKYDLPVSLYGFSISENMIYGLSREKEPIVYIFQKE